MFLLNRTKRKVVAACLIIGVILLPLIGPFIPIASALGSATWINQATISYNGVQYKENDATDDNWHFYAANPDNGCQQEIKDFTNPGYDSLKGPFKTQTVTLYKQKKVTGGCSPDGTEDIRLQADPPGYNVAFIWTDDKNIQSADGKKKFSQDASGDFISVTDSSACKDFITVGGDKSNPQLTVRSNKGTGDDASISLRGKYAPEGGSGWAFVRSINSAGDSTINGTDCHQSKPVSVGADATNAARPGTSTAPGSAGASNDNSCESKSGALGWILCPVIKLLDAIFNWLDTQIQSLLEVKENWYTEPRLYTAWSQIRNIAYIVLIPIMLVMVVATALGSDLFSAYTVKKAMPRMVAAILFISLSWYICTFLIGFFNVVGAGVIGLITNPFSLGGQITLANLFEPSAGGTVLQGAGGAAALGVGIFALFAVEGLAGILVLYFLGAVLALFIAFIVLTVRQLIILGLLLASPLAILAWIFPGNDKLWKLWWESFSKLLMMFPLITGLIGMGRVFAWIVGHTQSGGLEGGLLNPLLKITAYIVPYLLIPLTFKFAGGAFATLAGMANDRSKGVFDRLKKGRQAGWQKIGHNAKNNKLLRDYGGNNKAVRKAYDSINKKTQTATLAGAAGLTLDRNLRKNRIEAARSMREMEEMRENTEKLAQFQPIRKDDDKLWAAMKGWSDESVRKMLIDRAPSRFNEEDKKGDLDMAVQEVRAFQKKVGQPMAKKMATMANAATGTGYNYRQNADGTFKGDDDMLTAILDASGEDASLAGRMLAEMRPMAMQSGRPGLAGGGYAHTMSVMSNLRQARANGGILKDRNILDGTTGDVIGVEHNVAYGIDEARHDILQDVLRSNAGGAVAGKVKDVKQLAPVIRANAVGAMNAHGQADADGNVPEAEIQRTFEDAVIELATVAGKHDASSAIAPQNARVLRSEVMAQEVDVASLNPKLREALKPIIEQYEMQETKEIVRDPASGEMKEVTSSKPVKIGERATITISEAMEQMRDNPVFQQIRREYGRSAVNAANAQMAASAAAASGVAPAVAPIGGGPNPYGMG